VLYSITGHVFDYGETLSPVVHAAIPALLQHIHRSVAAWIADAALPA
jgi:hypothetical protein